MILSETAISIQHLQKVYRRYATNGWRALGLLGFPVPKGRYDEFWALDDVSLDIRRGERVALVGRNGAGKSTLLRHISGELTPTAGSVTVNGSVKALFGLGEGFHPEFSGLQNVRTALALHGISPREMERAIDDIVDFSELDDFIHRPMKEYSAGMFARLAFATATARAPDILIIDEILGAGDAYFLGKCMQRINAITSHGATVLFVSHDMGSALMLCQRGVWIHHGRLRADGDMVGVARAYQAHIREEQEAALHARAMRLTKRTSQAGVDGKALFRLIAEGECAPDDPVRVARIAVGSEAETLAEVAVGGQDGAGDIALLVDMKLNWGKAARHRGRLARPFGAFGGAFVHAPFTAPERLLEKDAWIELDVAPSRTARILLQRWDPSIGEAGAYADVGVIDPDPSEDWRCLRWSLEDLASVDVAPELADEGLPLVEDHPAEIGDLERLTQEVPTPAALPGPRSNAPARIRDFSFFDAEGRRRRTLVAGEPASAAFEIDVQAGLPGRPIAVVAIYRPDGVVISQLISPPEEKPVQVGAPSRLTMRMTLDELLIGPGDYIVSAAIFRELDPAKAPEDCAYELHDRQYPLKIVEADHAPYPLGLVRQKAHWDVLSAPVVSAPARRTR